MANQAKSRCHGAIPFFYKLIANQRPFKNGMYEMSNLPGWGWEYDADYLKSVRVG